MTLFENDEVRIHSTTSALDGKTGLICGKGAEYPGGVMYIVRLANEARPTLKMLDYNYSCVTLPDVCLERVA